MAPSLKSQMLAQAAAGWRGPKISPFLDSPLLIFREAVWDHYKQEVRTAIKYQIPGHCFELSQPPVKFTIIHRHN